LTARPSSIAPSAFQAYSSNLATTVLANVREGRASAIEQRAFRVSEKKVLAQFSARRTSQTGVARTILGGEVNNPKLLALT
jgi:hypothetical protein